MPAAVMPGPADDDPLTSPSFPRIAADDSRSYRRTRAAAPDARHSTGRESEALQPARNGRHAPIAQAEPDTAYPAVPRVESVSGLEAASQTRSYPRPGAGGSDFEAMTAGYGDTSADRSSPGYPVPASYQVPAASVPGYASATDGYLAPAEPPYSAPGHSYQAPDSYPPAARAGSDDHSAPGGISAAGYLPPVPGSPAGTGSYGGDTAARGSYRSSDLPGYSTDTGSGTYLGGLPGGYSPPSSSASYEGAGSYSLPPQSSGYHNGYADEAAGYQGYAESGSSSGAHRLPEPGYQAGGYSGSAEPGFAGSEYGGHGDRSYPAYPAPVPAEHGAPYQDPARQAGPYDPAGYPAPVHESGGYAGADPYAVDPYGQPGYGGNGY
jgi:hypothetical protein